MSYKIILNSIVLIPFLVTIESCMTPTSIPDSTTNKKSNSIKESKGSLTPFEGSIPKIEVKFLYSKDGGTSFDQLNEGSQLHFGDRLKFEIIPKEDAFIKILLVNNAEERQRADRQYGLTELKKGKRKLFPEKGSLHLNKTKAKETICVIAYKKQKEEKANSDCDHDNVVDKVSYQLN